MVDMMVVVFVVIIFRFNFFESLGLKLKSMVGRGFFCVLGWGVRVLW